MEGENSQPSNFYNRHDQFNIIYYNCRSLLPKFDELLAVCQSFSPDVVCLVETWLCKDIEDRELFIPNYNFVRQDRNRHGGGVAMYIHNSVKYSVLLTAPPCRSGVFISLPSQEPS